MAPDYSGASSDTTRRFGSRGDDRRATMLFVVPDAQTTFRLGVLALQSGRLEEAVDVLTRATTLAPTNAACHANLGEAHRRLGHSQAAIESFLRAIALEPALVAPVYNLGLALQECGASDGALACFERAAELNADAPDLGERVAAARSAAAGHDVAPDRANRNPADALSAHTLLALARPLALTGRYTDAVALLERAVRLEPRLTFAHCNLGLLKAALGQIHDAAGSYRRALELEPDVAETHHNLGNAWLRGGFLQDAIDSYRKAAALRPDHAAYHSELLFHLHFDPAYDARALLAEARAWERAHDAPRCAPAAPRDRAPDRRLRIGYVSPNFRHHCQAFFMMPLLEQHDHERFEIICYSDVARPDDWTHRLLGHADQVHVVVGVSDAALADRIAEDRVDILVDLTMHMAQSRLQVFARKPAPLQVCWLAYPGTTGLSAIDYRVADPYLSPPGSDEAAYAERPLLLPDTFWCYHPLTDQPPVSALPARRRGHVNFGSLNNLLKVGEATVALWARVLREVDGSTMTLLAPVGDARERTAMLFEAQGIARRRIEFVEYRPRLPYLATYESIDVCLDTSPYNGHTTSLDAFWMGVPVVTLVGSTIVGRAGLSQAMNLGLPELVARTPDEFVKIAVGLATDWDRLGELRAALRARIEASPLMDAPRFARNLEDAYRQIWRRWCEDGP
jgi:predicted O-linked N-acetylglucosamine transferase (SPINDLY family)